MPRKHVPDLDILESPLISAEPFGSLLGNMPPSALAEKIFNDPHSWQETEDDHQNEDIADMTDAITWLEMELRKYDITGDKKRLARTPFPRSAPDTGSSSSSSSNWSILECYGVRPETPRTRSPGKPPTPRTRNSLPPYTPLPSSEISFPSSSPSASSSPSSSPDAHTLASKFTDTLSHLTSESRLSIRKLPVLPDCPIRPRNLAISRSPPAGPRPRSLTGNNGTPFRRRQQSERSPRSSCII